MVSKTYRLYLLSSSLSTPLVKLYPEQEVISCYLVLASDSLACTTNLDLSRLRTVEKDPLWRRHAPASA